jgi:hypothetical protein
MKKLLLSLLCLGMGIGAFAQGTLTSSPPLVSNNGQAGITFQVSANTPVDITGISCHLDAGLTGVDIWMRVGGVSASGSPSITTAAGWTRVVTNAAAPGANNGVTAITLPAPIAIPANTPVGFHINSLGGSFVNYQTGTSADQVIYTDGTFTLNVSDSVSYGGGPPSPTFNPRRFLGSVTYALGISGGCANLFSNFSVDSISTDTAQINWTPGSGNTGFRVEYGPQGFTQGNGTIVTGTYPGPPPPLNISGLVPDTDYDVYFTEYCGTDSVYFPAPQQFRTQPICPAVSNVTITALDSNSVTFTYTATTDSINWEWGPSGFTQGTGTSGSSVGDTITITGLSPNTGYDLQIVSDCSDRGDSLSRPTTLSFTTDCGYASARFVENFDAAAFPCISAFINTTAGAPAITITTFQGPTSGTQQLQMTNSSATGANDDVMLLFQPFFGVSGLNKQIQFNAKTTSTQTTTLELVSIPDPTDPSVYNLIQTVTLSGAHAQYTIPLDAASNYNGTDEYFALRHGVQSTFQTIYVDDFVFDAIPTCPAVNPFTVNTSVGGSDVFLNWVSASAANGANVQYGTTGFALGAGTTVNVPDTFAVVTGLVANTSYDFYIQDSCAAGDLAAWVGPFTVLTGCAAPSATVLPWSDGFENFTTGPTFNGTTNLCQTSYSWRFDASDETASRLRLQAGSAFYNSGSQAATLDHTPSVTAAQSNFLTLTVNLSSYTTSGGINLSFYVMSHAQETHPDNRVWVRGAPSDPWVELVNLDLLPAPNGSYDSVKNVDIVAPLAAAGQTVGNLTQIRFGQNGRFGAFSTTFSDGFTFDDISLEAVSCPQPGGLAVTSLLDTTATLTWNGPGAASQYQYWFGSGGFYQGTQTAGGVQVFTNSTSALVDTLSPQFCYEFLVRSICGPGDTSMWAGPFSFCTPCSPVSAPYSENWDALSTGKDVGCFTPVEDPAFNTSTFQGVNVVAFGSPFSGARQIELDNSSSTLPLMIVSPPTTDMTAGDKRVVVRARQSFAAVPPSEMIIGTMSNPNDANTFNALDTFALDDLTPHSRYISEITTANGYNGTDNFFAIRHGANATFRTIYVDDVIYEVIPTCPEASGLEVLSVDSMNAEVAFVPASGSSGTFQIEYGTGTLGSAANSQVIVSNDTASLSMLMGGTNYCFWVREICTPGDTSNWTGPECFKTQCLSIQAPYFNDWDQLSFGNDIGCFIKIEDPSLAPSTFQGLTIQTSTFNQPNSPPNVLEFDNGSLTASPLIAVSPKTRDLQAGDKRVRFFARTNSTFNVRTLIVGSITNPQDANTFSALDTITMTATMTEYTVNFDAANGYNGTDDHFAIAHGQNSTFQTIFVDDLNYEVIPTCIRPTNFTNLRIGSDDAVFSWDADTATSSGNYVIQYGINNPSLGAAGNTILAFTSDSVVVSGLTDNTNYCFWVADVCAPGDTSIWVGPICLSTNCLPSTAPYLQDFENTTVGHYDGANDCWTISSNNPGTTSSGGFSWEARNTAQTTSGTGTGPDRDNTLAPTIGGVFMTADVSGSANGDSTVITSPIIDISGLSNPELTYFYHRHGTNMAELHVDIFDGSSWINGVHSYTALQGTNTSQADPYQDTSYSLSAYSTVTNFQVRFRLISNGCCSGDVAIDDVSIADPITCARPTGLSAEGTSTTSAVARWNADPNANSYEVEYGTPGFSLGTGTNLTTTADSLVLNFASANNLCQEVYLRSICGAGDTSLWLGPVSVCPEPVLCDSLDQYNSATSAAPIWDQSALFVEWAGNLGGETEVSTAQAASAPNSIRIHDTGPSGISDVVALFDTLSAGAWEISFDMYIPVGKGGYYNIQQNYVGGGLGNLWGGEVYFLDNGTAEVVYTTGSVLAGTFTYTQGQWFEITTILDLDNDTIWFEYNGNSTNVGYQYSLANAGGPIQFNGINFYSGVKAGSSYSADYYFDNFCMEPYSVACPIPTGVSATNNMGCDSVEIDWTSGSGTSFIVYGPAGFNPATGGTNTGNVTAPHVISGLTPGTSYDFYLADVCGADTSSFVTINETTPSGPLPVASFNIDSAIVNNIYEVYVDASASANATSYSWNFGNGVSGNSVTDTVAYASNGTYTITLVVSNACGSDTATFVTNANVGLQDNPLTRSLNLFPNPADDQVSVQFSSFGSGQAEIRVLDMQGREVIRLSAQEQSGRFNTQIDISDLANGVYMIEVSSGNMTARRRVSVK